MIGRQWRFPELYRVLGVHPEASADEIEAAYFRLTNEYHDDLERQRALGAAWAVLGDRQRRARYDREAVGGALSEWAEAARPLVIWTTIYVTAGAVLLAFGGRDAGSLTLWAYVVACTPWGWRALTRVRRWLGLRGWLPWLYCVCVSPVIGAFVAPVYLVTSAVDLALLAVGLLSKLDRWSSVIRALRTRSRRLRG